MGVGNAALAECNVPQCNCIIPLACGNTAQGDCNVPLACGNLPLACGNVAPGDCKIPLACGDMAQGDCNTAQGSGDLPLARGRAAQGSGKLPPGGRRHRAASGVSPRIREKAPNRHGVTLPPQLTLAVLRRTLVSSFGYKEMSGGGWP